MGKWTCQCGYPMNDHAAPDPNASRYSRMSYGKR